MISLKGTNSYSGSFPSRGNQLPEEETHNVPVPRIRSPLVPFDQGNPIQDQNNRVSNFLVRADSQCTFRRSFKGDQHLREQRY